MENRSNAVAAAGRPTVQSTPLLRKPRRVVHPAARKDLQVGAMPRTNVLVIGRTEAVRIVLDMLRLDLRGPILPWFPGQPLELPLPGRAATLLLNEVTRLTNEEQYRVVCWLDQVGGQVRVVSTTSVSLWPRVKAGEFNEVLYYRLNTMYVDVGT